MYMIRHYDIIPYLRIFVILGYLIYMFIHNFSQCCRIHCSSLYMSENMGFLV